VDSFVANEWVGGAVDKKRFRKSSRVPTSRIERFARMGMMAGKFALSGVAETAKRVMTGEMESLSMPFLTPANAQNLARSLSKMRGASMKLGQLLSMESDDLLPPEFTEVLSVLRSSADTMPDDQLRRVLGQAYGKGWEEKFLEFDFDPIASASIGQVHRAVANDGRVMALKIQYPGIGKSIASDVDNLASLLRVARILPGDFDSSGIIAEAKRELRREADYLLEAENLRRYRKLIGDDEVLCVPQVFEDYSTKHVLAMEFMEGIPLEELIQRGRTQKLRDQVGAALTDLMFRELFEFKTMQTDPNLANYLVQPAEGRIVLLDLGAMQDLAPDLTKRYRRLVKATIAGDREKLRSAALSIGFLLEEDNPRAAEALLDLMLLSCDPMSTNAVYDFGDTDLAGRVREMGMELAFEHGLRRSPPAETLFIHRKIGGNFLLCTRLKCRINIRAIADRYVNN